MNSHDALVDYGRPVVEGSSRIQLDLFPAIPTSFGETHHAMVRHFNMAECKAVPGLMTLQAKCNQAAFLEFFGRSWDEAITRWPTLALFHEYRQHNGPEYYTSVSQWQAFYQLVSAAVEPETITVAFVEHY